MWLLHCVRVSELVDTSEHMGELAEREEERIGGWVRKRQCIVLLLLPAVPRTWEILFS